MAPPRTPRTAWIEAGLEVLAEGGPDAVKVEPLAARLGVTKGGFYWHFKDRAALLDALLDAWEQTGVDEVIARVETEGGDARDRLRGLFAIAFAGDRLLRIDLAIRDWGRRDEAVKRRLQRVDDRRMAYLRELFGPLAPGDDDEVEARALIAFTVFVGSPFIAASHGGRTRRDVAALALERLLLR
ncbi:MAG TPA: TetR/AcrR family transcriptional regulator [Solirubrobacteraceae bacterium]|nr:TetR/AcrR family transcriptional regulator [Solirubrobacteraceae bacterium]